jgi:hypothetical protein
MDIDGHSVFPDLLLDLRDLGGAKDAKLVAKTHVSLFVAIQPLSG